MKIIIIDAFNLIYKNAFLKEKLTRGIDIAAASLIEILKTKSNSNKYIVAFDGEKQANISCPPNIRIIYSGKGNTADKIIRELIAKSKQSKITCIVSSDTEVYNYARIHAMEAVLSEKFPLLNTANTTHLTSSAKGGSKKGEKPMNASKKEIKEFLELFGSAEE